MEADVGALQAPGVDPPQAPEREQVVAEQEDPVGRHDHVVEEQHRVLLVETPAQVVGVPRGGQAAQRLPAQHLQARGVHRQREPDHELLGVALGGDAVEVHQNLVRQRRERGQLLGTADDDAVRPLLDHAQRQVGVVDRAGAAVDLRVAERMGQHQVVLAGEAVVALRVLPEARPVSLQLVAVVVKADHDVGHEVRRPVVLP